MKRLMMSAVRDAHLKSILNRPTKSWSASCSSARSSAHCSVSGHATGPLRETNQRRLGQRSDWNVVRSSLFQTPPPFVVNLGRGHMPVTEQFLDLDDVHPGIEEQRRRGRPQRMRRVDVTSWLGTRMEEQTRNPPPADGLVFQARDRTEPEAEPPLLLNGLLVAVGSAWII